VLVIKKKESRRLAVDCSDWLGSTLGYTLTYLRECRVDNAVQNVFCDAVIGILVEMGDTLVCGDQHEDDFGRARQVGKLGFRKRTYGDTGRELSGMFPLILERFEARLHGRSMRRDLIGAVDDNTEQAPQDSTCHDRAVLHRTMRFGRLATGSASKAMQHLNTVRQVALSKIIGCPAHGSL